MAEPMSYRGDSSTIGGNCFLKDRGNASTIPEILPRYDGKSFHHRRGNPSTVPGKFNHLKGEILPPFMT
jgi:hypothetical protein